MTDEAKRRLFERFLGAEVFAYLWKVHRLDGEDVVFGLTGYERLAILVYTTPFPYHAVINGSLWSGEPSADIIGFSRILTAAIERRPVFTGTVYRGLAVEEAEFEARLDGWNTARRLRFPGFTSTSPHAKEAFNLNVLMRIRSRSGRLLQGYSADDSVTEVLFPPGVWYSIENVTLRERRIFLDLREDGP